MAGIAEPSVKSLLIQMQFNGQLLATGTGFVVNSNSGPALITNRHNVTGRHQDTGEHLLSTVGIPNEIQILQNRQNRLGEWVPRVEPILIGGQPLWIEHPTLGERADFVALPLTQLNDVEINLMILITPVQIFFLAQRTL